MTNIIILPSSLFQQFGQWSDTRSWKTRSMSVPLPLKLLQTNSCVFCFPCSGLWRPLAFKGSPSCFCLWSDVMEALYFHQRQSHVYVDTGRDLFRVRHQGGNWPDICRIWEESEISIKWIWNSWSSRLCSLRYSVFSFIFPCIHRQFGLECSVKKICVWSGSGSLLMRGMEGLVGPWHLQICHIRKSPQLAPAR